MIKIFEEHQNVSIYSWTESIEEMALKQAIDLTKLPFIFHHVALMPDVHPGYGMPIGGVIACDNVVIPNAVGVDIGCGMIAVQTDRHSDILNIQEIRKLFDNLAKLIPVGKGCFKEFQDWKGFEKYESCFMKDLKLLGWYTDHIWNLAKKSIGSLGSGNHFLELQKGDDGFLWLMIHSGSRNLGYKIAEYYNKIALDLNHKFYSSLPNKDLAFLPVDSQWGQDYIRDMNFALSFAFENRQIMMNRFKECLNDIFPYIQFSQEINIHHNYANLENHYGKNVWVHRKGSTSAKNGELGIIPGSMGTPSYIVKGLGNRDSFMSCSHGAGRPMSRTDASKKLTKEECDKSMKGIICGRWNKIKRGKLKGEYDLSEAPGAYKNINVVISEQKDLVTPIVKLEPIGSLKG